MESAPNTSPRLKPAAPYSSDPRERFEAQRMEGDCKGHSPATHAAMAWIIAATVPDARVRISAHRGRHFRLMVDGIST